MKLNLDDPDIVSVLKTGTTTATAYKSGGLVLRDDATGWMGITYNNGDKVEFQHDGTQYRVIKIESHDGLTWNEKKTTTHLDG